MGSFCLSLDWVLTIFELFAYGVLHSGGLASAFIRRLISFIGMLHLGNSGGLVELINWYAYNRFGQTIGIVAFVDVNFPASNLATVNHFTRTPVSHLAKILDFYCRIAKKKIK